MAGPRFKMTPLGQLPEDWDVATLHSLAREIRNGFASGERDEKNGIVQIRMNNVTNDGRLRFDEVLKVPRPDGVDDFILKKGDFLFNNTNSWELVGKSAVFHAAPFSCVFSNHFTRIRFKDAILPDFVLYHFLGLWKSGVFRSAAIRHVGQSAVQTSFLKKIRLPVPPPKEQERIVALLGLLDKEIAQTDEIIEKARVVKKGLMQDLLTGRVRFPEFPGGTT